MCLQLIIFLSTARKKEWKSNDKCKWQPWVPTFNSKDFRSRASRSAFIPSRASSLLNTECIADNHTKQAHKPPRDNTHAAWTRKTSRKETEWRSETRDKIIRWQGEKPGGGDGLGGGLGADRFGLELLGERLQLVEIPLQGFQRKTK